MSDSESYYFDQLKCKLETVGRNEQGDVSKTSVLFLSILLLSLSLQLVWGQRGVIGENKFIWWLVSNCEISLTSVWSSLVPSAGDYG